MSSLMPDLSSLGLVRRGELNFEEFCEVLSTRGYIIEITKPFGLVSTAIEKCRQDDLDALFRVLYPEAPAWHDIELRTIATDKGGQRGCFTYAVFNEALMARDECKRCS